ncbi:hypothetical protein FIBSPDRAFT_1038257 [Athelia psychrophila]|uniref:Uncharacterized protein n=1 Tax=Athelia psychrophila TaxID=1759441 RepID=A0A166TIG6_9AGAM|nr:hypothetical protein FIBSPDRAFT_1038257 [Fibularhizoctonia sp. CBS 109695]
MFLKGVCSCKVTLETPAHIRDKENLNQGLANVLNLVQHLERHNLDQAAQLAAARLCFEHSEKCGFLKFLIILDNATLSSVLFLLQNPPRQNVNINDLVCRRSTFALTFIASLNNQSV